MRISGKLRRENEDYNSAVSCYCWITEQFFIECFLFYFLFNILGLLNIGTVEHGSPYMILCAYGLRLDVNNA